MPIVAIKTLWYTHLEDTMVCSFRPVADNEPSALTTVSSEQFVVSGYYDLFGKKLVKEPASGIYIIESPTKSPFFQNLF